MVVIGTRTSSLTVCGARNARLLLIGMTCVMAWLPVYLVAQEPDTPAKFRQDAAVVVQQGHLAQVSTVAFGEDGQVLVSASFDGTVRIWDVGTGKLVRILRGATRASSPPPVAISPDGRLLGARIARDEVGIWDLATGRQLRAWLRQRNWI